MSTEKTKIPASQGNDPIPSKLCIDNRIPERVDKLSYLDYALLYQGEVYISSRAAKYIKATGVINNALKPSLICTKAHSITPLQNFSLTSLMLCN
jgi:hypothetical protein